MKSITPTKYERIQKITVSCASLLVLAGKVIDSGRQSATNQIPKTNARMEITPCKIFIIKRRGVLENASKEKRLRGSINITAENPTNHTHITTSNVISCTK